ncbi:MAG: YtxH domain-containing protein [Bacteroidia bacterium]
MEKENQTGEIIVAVMAGVAIGGILGVLFAPDKGTETRKKLFGNLDFFSKSDVEEEESPATEKSQPVGQAAMM